MFGAHSVTELFSRTCTVQRGFLDVFRFSIRGGLLAEIDQIRIDTALLLCVQIKLQRTDGDGTVAHVAAPVEFPTVSPDPANTPVPPVAVGEVVTLDELAALAINAGITLNDSQQTFGAQTSTAYQDQQ